jgi:hypothetical protein
MQLKRKFKKYMAHQSNPEIRDRIMKMMLSKPDDRINHSGRFSGTIKKLESICDTLKKMVELELQGNSEISDLDRDGLFLQISEIENKISKLILKYQDVSFPIEGS